MRRKHLTFSIVFLLLCSFIALVAVSQEKSLRQLENEMETAYKNLYNPEYGAWPRYKAKFDFYQGKILEFITEHNKLTGTKLSPKLEWASALVDGIDKNMTAYYLSESLKTLLVEIDNAGNDASFFYIDVVLKAWYEYYDAVGAYNYKVSPEERISIQQPSEYAATPIFLCQGSCDARFETALAAQVSHQVYCQEKHGSSGTTDVPLYACSGTCDRSKEHWRVCGGSCGKKFAPKRINRGQGNYSYVANSPHYVSCSHELCVREYYTCESSTCPDSNTHVNDNTPNCPDCTWDCSPCRCSNSGTCGGTVVDNTPNCSGCTSHCSSPCSCSNSGTCNGTVVDNSPDCDSCTTGGCSACPTVCTACNQPYNPNSTYHVNLHRLRECRFSGCGNSWHACSISGWSPPCNNPYRKSKGWNCGAK